MGIVQNEVRTLAERMMTASYRVRAAGEALPAARRAPLALYADTLKTASQGLEAGTLDEAGAQELAQAVYGKEATSLKEKILAGFKQVRQERGLTWNQVNVRKAQLVRLPSKDMIPAFQKIVEQTKDPEALHQLYVTLVDMRMELRTRRDGGPALKQLTEVGNQLAMHDMQIRPAPTTKNVQELIGVADRASDRAGHVAVLQALLKRAQDEGARQQLRTALRPYQMPNWSPITLFDLAAP